MKEKSKEQMLIELEELYKKSEVEKEELINANLQLHAQNLELRKQTELQNISTKKRLREAERIGKFGNWSYEVETGKVIWSEGMFLIYGRDKQKDEVNYENLIGWIHENDRDIHNAYFEKMLELKPNEKLKDLEYRILWPNGDIHWVRVRFESHFNNLNKASLFFGTATLITSEKKAAEELKESKQLLETITENFPNSFVSVINKDFTVGFTSGQEFKKQNLDPNNFIGLSLKDVFGDYEPVIQKYYEKTFAGEEQVFELLFGEQYQQYKSIPLVYYDGEIEKILVVVENITERKKIAEEIQFQASLIEQVESAIITLDFNNKILSWNDYAEKLYQWTKEEAIGKDILELLGTDEWRKKTTEIIKDLNRNGRWEGDYEVKRKDGVKIPIRMVNTFLKNKDGKKIGSIGVGTDISERKNAEIELQESEKKHRLLLENTNSGVAYYDLNGFVVLINKIGAKNLGGKPDDFIGKHLSDFLDKAMTDFVMDRILKTINKDEFAVYEDVLELPPGTLYLSSTYNPIKNANNEIIGVQIISTNISERKRAEIKLKESEQQLKEAQLIAGMGNFTMDIETGIVLWSEAMYELLGYNHNEKLDFKKVNEAIHHPDDLERVSQWLQECMQATDKNPRENQYRILKKDGTVIHVHVIIRTDVKNGKPEKIFGTVQDITEEKNAEKKLKESEERLRLSQKAGHIGIWSININTGEQYLSEVAASFHGLQEGNYSKDDLFGMVHDEDLPALNQAFQQTVEKAVELNIEFRIINKKTRKAICVQARGQAITDSNGKTILVNGTVLNITERKNADEKLKESEEKFRSIFQQSPLAIQLYDPDGNLLDVNPKTLELFGLDDIKYVSGFNFWNDPSLSEKDIESLKNAKSVCVSTSYNFDTFGNSIEFPTSRKGHIYLDMYVMPMKSEGSIVGYLVQIVEVTDKKLAEDEVKKHRDHLEEMVNNRTTELKSINKELEAFSYSVSHDLRAPLRAINGFTRILMEDYVEKLDDEGKRLGGVIQKNSNKMGKLIDDLLSFSRLGRTPMQYSSIDMKKMAIAIYHEATSSSERKQIKFSIADLPDTYGDTNMFRLVWMNLISNAIKFSSKREKAVISITSTQDNEKTTYQISDNGTGFDMQYVNKIFDVFQRLHGEKEYPGTGVGLSLVQRIINRHKGNIWAESEVDKGATFYFSLSKITEIK